MGKKGSTPKAPDPQQTAAAQTKSNMQTAEFNADINRINEYTPLGNLTYNKTGGFDQAGYDRAMQDYYSAMDAYRAAQAATTTAPSYGNGTGTTGGGGMASVGSRVAMPTMPSRDQFSTAPEYSRSVTLSPEVQRVFDAQMGNDAALAELAGSRMGSVTDALSAPLPSTNQDDVIEAIMSRLQPQFDRDEDRMRTRLVNSGADPTVNERLYGTEMGLFNQAKNDARMQALLAAPQYAGQELNNAILARTQPLNEVLAMKNGSQVNMPQFSGTPQVASPGVNIADMIMQGYNADVNANNAKVAQQNSILSGLFGLGAAGILA